MSQFVSVPSSSLNALGTTLRTRTLLGADRDVFGQAVTASRISQIRADYDQALAANDVTATLAGGGTAVVSAGLLTLSTTSAVTASSKVASNRSIRYAPGREIYAQFTAWFTTPTSAASDQRAGVYDDNNGMFIGYDGLTFGLTTRTGAADTFVARTAFNGDLLDGGASSDFTRAGVPEAINLTYLNVFRIRFGWLGSALILFEVMAPDGQWVLFHTIRRPNLSASPSIQSPHLPIRFEAIKSSSDATNVQVGSSSWDGGTVESGVGVQTEDVNGNVYRTAQVSAQTADATVYTVSTGRRLKITNMFVFVRNDHASVAGQLLIRDGGVGGTILLSVEPDDTATQSSSQLAIPLVFPTPLQVETSVFADVVSGTLTYSIMFVGYEVSDV